MEEGEVIKISLLKKRGYVKIDMLPVLIAFAIIFIMSIIIFIFKVEIEGVLNILIKKIDYIVRSDITLLFLLLVFTILIMSSLIFNIRKLSNRNEERLYDIEEEFEKYKLETKLKLYLFDNRYLLMDAATRSEITESELMNILDRFYLDNWISKEFEGEYDSFNENSLKEWSFISNKVISNKNDFFGIVIEEDEEVIYESDILENEFENKYTKKIVLFNR